MCFVLSIAGFCCPYVHLQKKQVTPCVTCLGASCTLGFLDRSVIYQMDRAFVRHIAHYRSSAGQIHESTRWWFQIVFIFNPTWGNDPI